MRRALSKREDLLEDFVREMRGAIKSFKSWYWAQHLVDDEQFPRSLTPGEWDDLFRVWKAMHMDDNDR